MPWTLSIHQPEKDGGRKRCCKPSVLSRLFCRRQRPQVTSAVGLGSCNQTLPIKTEGPQKCLRFLFASCETNLSTLNRDQSSFPLLLGIRSPEPTKCPARHVTGLQRTDESQLLINPPTFFSGSQTIANTKCKLGQY